MDRHGTTQLLSKSPPALTVGIGLRCLDSLKDCPHTVATSFRCDEDTGVENQSHAERSRGLRLWMISLRSVVKSGSIVGS